MSIRVDYYLEQAMRDGTWARVAMFTDNGVQSHSDNAEFAIDMAKSATTLTRVVKRTRHKSYRVKNPGDHGTRYDGPPTIRLRHGASSV